MTYGKLFESLYTGSMVGSGPLKFAVWTYCIAMSKPPGEVELNPTLVAAAIGGGVTKADIKQVMEEFCEPDEESRSPEEDGRRLVKLGHFLYRMPTWPKYNEIRKDADRREQNRKSQQVWRDKQKNPVSDRKQDKPTEMETTDGDGDGDGMNGLMDDGSSLPSQNEPTPVPAVRTGQESAGTVAESIVREVTLKFQELDA